jgi:tetratricopeptide (TPR) repeat protein
MPDPQTRKDSVWKVGGVYVAGAWAVLQVVDVLAQNVGLPTWAFSMALVLLLIGLPIVVGTAYLHGLAGRSGSPARARDDAPRRLLTWRNAILGGVGAFALFGLSVGIYFVLWATGVGPIGSLVAKGVLEEDDPVILADFENETLDPQLASVVTSTLRVDLEQSSVIRLLPEGYVANSLQRMGREPSERVTGEIAREVAIREGVKAVIEGEVGALGSGFVLTARIVDPETGASFSSFRETAASGDELVPALDRLSRSLRERAGESLRSITDTEPLARVTTASLPALRTYSEAIALEEDGKLLEATALLEEALEEDSAFAMAHRKLAVIYGNRGENELRREYAAKAFEHRDRLTDLERHLASAYYHSAFGDRQRAIQEYEAVLRIDPEDGSALNNLAVMYRLVGRLEEAVELLDRAVSGVGESNNAYANLVEDLLELGRVADARAALEQFESRFPEQYWMFRARALLGISESDSPAVHDAAEAILLDPGASQGRKRGALRYMAMVDIRLGHHREGASHLLEAARQADSLGFGGGAAFFAREAAFAYVQLGAGEVTALMEELDGRARTSGRGSAGDIAFLHWRLGDTGAISELARETGTWPEGEPDIEAAILVVQGCAGCMRRLEVELLRDLGSRQQLIDNAEDLLARPLDASRGPADEPLVRLYLAEAYEEVGNAQAAADNYARFAELWSNADPELLSTVARAEEKAAALASVE